MTHRREGRRDNSMMYDITAITALMEVDDGDGVAAAAAARDGDGLAVTGQTDSLVMDSVIALGAH